MGGLNFLGLRAGVGFDLGSFFKRLRRQKTVNAFPGSFVYVIRGDHGMNKIGVSTDPNTRISDLQTGSPFALHFEFIGMTSGSGYDIETEAHAMLDRHRQEGEWFKVPAEMAVAAVHASAHRLGHLLTPVPQNDIDAALRGLTSKNEKPEITFTGKAIGLAYIAVACAVNQVYDGHLLSIIIVAMLIGVTIVKPFLLRHFAVPTGLSTGATQPN